MKMDLCLAGALVALAIAALPSVANAQSTSREPVLPQQVIPTGAEDARPTENARAAAAAAVNTQARSLEQELVRMTSESSEGLVAVQRVDSGVTVDLEGRFMSVLVATPTEDGGHAVSCYTGHDAVTQADRARDIATGKAPKLAVKHEHADEAKPKTVQAPALEEK